MSKNPNASSPTSSLQKPGTKRLLYVIEVDYNTTDCDWPIQSHLLHEFKHVPASPIAACYAIAKAYVRNLGHDYHVRFVSVCPINCFFENSELLDIPEDRGGAHGGLN